MSDCEQGLLCLLDRCMVPGTEPPIAAPGGACLDPDTRRPISACQIGEGCNYETGTCEPFAALGESCKGGTPCAEGWCDAGTCAAPQANGATCEFGFECEMGRCSSGVCADNPNPPVIACFPWAL